MVSKMPKYLVICPSCGAEHFSDTLKGIGDADEFLEQMIKDDDKHKIFSCRTCQKKTDMDPKIHIKQAVRTKW